MKDARALGAEALGTFWLVLGGCGSAVIANQVSAGVGIGLLGVSLAFGLTVVTGAYALGHISGGHFNPAVTIGLWAAGSASTPARSCRTSAPRSIGAILASLALWGILEGQPGVRAQRQLAGRQRLRHDGLARRLQPGRRPDRRAAC